MRISVDSKNDVMRIKFQEGKYDKSKEFESGIVVDLTQDNKIMAIEILDVSERIPKKSLKEIAVSISG